MINRPIWHNSRFSDLHSPIPVINGLNRLFARARDALKPHADPAATEPVHEPEVIDSRRHGIDRAGISPNALKVLNRLRDGGHDAFIVGGGVRDLLLGWEPKDFDVATDALPEEVKRLFRNCRLIGRRFRLAHVFFGREIIEVATFRAASDDGSGARRVESGRLVRDNVYGGIEDDAVRRDFTINALYYDAHANEVLDFTNGFADLKAGMLRLIGDPAKRFREDPVRLLRAARFSAKLGFRIHPATEHHMPGMGKLLADIAPARLYDEVIKLFLTGHGLASFEQLRHYGLFEHLFPDTERSLGGEDEGFPRTLISHALANTDERVAEGKPVIPAFIFAALLWDPMRLKAEEFQRGDMGEREALDAAAEWIIKDQAHVDSQARQYPHARDLDAAAALSQETGQGGHQAAGASALQGGLRFPADAVAGGRFIEGAGRLVDRASEAAPRRPAAQAFRGQEAQARTPRTQGRGQEWR